jgi:small-conductance mechanosensitive channel
MKTTAGNTNRHCLRAIVARYFFAVFAVWLLLGSAYSQQPPAPTPASETAAKLGTLTSQERIDLIAKLDDQQVRELVLYYLGQLAPPATQQNRPEDLLKELEQRAGLLRANAIAAVGSIGRLPAAVQSAHKKLTDGLSVGYAAILAVLAALVIVAAGIEWLYWLAIRSVRQKLGAEVAHGGEGWLRSTLAILLLEVIGVALFASGYILAFLAVWQGNEARRQLVAAVLVGILVVRLTRTFARALFGPESAGERVIPVTQAGAHYLCAAASRTAIVGVGLIIPAYLISLWSGDPHARMLLMAVASGVFSIYAGWQVWSTRHYVAEAFVSSDEDGRPVGWPMRALASAWAPLVIAYLAAVYLCATALALAGAPIGITRAFAALLGVMVGVPVLDRFVGFFLESRRTVESPDAIKGHQGTIVRRAARIVLVVGAVLIVLGSFGLASLATQRLGSWLIRLTLDIGLVVLIAYVLREFAVAWINRQLAGEASPGTPTAAGIQAARASRLKTILPLVRRALQVAILTIATLMILSALGVNVGPLLAGAGVIGLAVGFGSQTLVKDLISGLFFLLDDAFRVGEYIEVGGFAGEVERINVRSLSLRTPEGAIHTVPFGGIDAVANYSRDWAIVKLQFRVTYDTDMTKVKKIFRKIGEELAADPELGPTFLQPFKFQGVKAMEETGILFRGKFMAVPGTQFQARKVIFERVQKAFAENGIEFAQRRVQVNLPAGQEADKDAVARAAAAAIAAEPAAAPR